MTDPRFSGAVEEEQGGGAISFNIRDTGWTGRLVLYLRAMAVLSLVKGLYHWAEVCGFIGEEGGFEAHTQPWQVTTVFFSIIDLVAAIGLWLGAPWGAVVWLTSTVSMIVINVFFDQVYGTDNLLIGVGTLAITVYLALSILAAREHPR